MIIECINCNKRFNVDSELIPLVGRQIQCGSCNHTWHYIIKEESSKILILDDTKEQKETKNDNSHITKDNENLIKNKQSRLLKQVTDINKDNKEIKDNSISNFFSYLLIFIISSVAILIIIDTLKSPLINIFPHLEIILFNLFETLKDVKLFIIDLT